VSLRRKILQPFVMAGMRPPTGLPRLPGAKRVDLRGKRVLLTGASSGIGGRGRKFADAGPRGRGRPPPRLLGALAARITDRGGDAEAVTADLSDLDAIDELVKSVGPVDILINNAGRSIRRPWPSHWIAGTTSSAR
jgi:NAD(P)-dependent dehydrogenase (short-subunit alcohol dehydrogenase family)